ncbi:MAG: phosphoesterase, partial [Azonexus sp.]
MWPLKAFGTTGFMVLFFWGYFGVMQNPLFTPTVMPLTIIDEWIPFTPVAFGFYVSLWLYVSLPPA